MSKFLNLEALILKRHNYSEAHRFITLFSQSHGKINALAKGIRKINSSRRASLEPFNIVKLQLVDSHGYWLITETKLIHSFTSLRDDLFRLTQAYQLLEILDTLTAEAEAHPDIYYKLTSLLHLINQSTHTKTHLIDTINFMLEDLGFGLPIDPSEHALKSHLESITDRPLRSKQYFLQTSIH